MNKNGLSLIEVLISIALIGIIFIIFGASLNSLHSQRYSENKNIAYGIAEAELEILKTYPFASHTNRTNEDFVGIPPTHDVWNLLNEGVGFLTISDWENFENIKEITAKIQWIDNKGTRSIELKTLLSE